MKLSDNQMRSNLRRTANKGFLSFLDDKLFHCLIIKHFGIIENGVCVGYTDPYTGLPIKNNSDLVLEHIIPVISGGGTVIFNCVPASSSSNSAKSDRHLIHWWKNTNYYSDDRLVKLINYILEAYEISFNLKAIKSLVDEYGIYVDSQHDFSSDSDNDDVYANMTNHDSSDSKNINDYYGFLVDCISELPNESLEAENLRKRLSALSQSGIFEDINNYEKIQLILKEIIVDYLGDDDRKYLTILLNVNITNLVNSIPKKLTLEEKKEIIITRLNNVESILKERGIGIISFFENIGISQELINQDISNISDDRLNLIINSIKLSIDDRFNKLISFIENNNRYPNQKSENEMEKILAVFMQQIKSISITKKGTKIFNVSLSQKQLEYLHNSESTLLNNIYKEILNKSIENNTPISYIDEEMSLRIKEFYLKIQKIKDDNSLSKIDEVSKLEQEYSDVIIISDQFNAFISFVNSHQGNLPLDISESEDEATLGRTRFSIQVIKKESNGRVRFAKKLSYEQLKYLHDSEYQSLKEIYKTILIKSIEYNIPIDYVDEELKARILEYKQRKEELAKNCENISIDDQIKLHIEYRDVSLSQDKFIQTIIYVLENNKIPRRRGKTQEEIDLGNYFAGTKTIHRLKSGKVIFNCSLDANQLKYLCHSNNEELKKHYIEILTKSILNNISIDYVDGQLKNKICEYYQEMQELKNSDNWTIENQIIIQRKYQDILFNRDKFLDLISFVMDNGRLPSAYGKTEEEKQLGQYKNNLMRIDYKRDGKMSVSLNNQQISYLLNSNETILVELGQVIVERMNPVNPQLEGRGIKR